MEKIELEDRTKNPSTDELLEMLQGHSEEVAKALVALSENDQKIVEQVKEALQEITASVLKLDAKLNLLSDLFEVSLIQSGAEKEEVKKYTLEEYKGLIEKLSRI